MQLDRFKGEENVTVDYFDRMSSLSEAVVTTIELEADAVRPLLAPIRPLQPRLPSVSGLNGVLQSMHTSGG